MQNHQASEIGSGGVVGGFHDWLLLLESVTVSILRGVYYLFLSESTMWGNRPSDEVGKSYTHTRRRALAQWLARQDQQDSRRGVAKYAQILVLLSLPAISPANCPA